MIKTDRKGPFCLVAASLFWSLGGVCIKLIPWGATSIIGLRACLAAMVFAIYRKKLKIDLTFGNCAGALFLSGTTISFVFANQLTTAAAAILLQFTAPAFILLYQFVLYRKKPKPGEVLAVACTIAGMMLFFGDNIGEGRLLGNLVAIGSGMCFAGVFVCNKRPDTDPDQSIMLGFYINAVLFAPFALFDQRITAALLPWGLIILLGVVQVGLAYVLFAVGIKRTPALLACLITALEPVLNPVLVAFVTPERPGRFAIIGGVIIVATIVTYNIWAERRTSPANVQ